jgi:DNA-binding NarL/FixJ family response regulator
MPTATRSRTRVLVADDHRPFAEALALAIEQEKDLTAVVALSALEALESCERDRPNVALVAVALRGMGGIEAIRRIRGSSPDTNVIALFADDDLTQARALEAGARGFLSTVTPLAEVPMQIRMASQGLPLVDTEEVSRLFRVLRHRRHQESTERQRASRLTPRQLEILQLLSDGIAPATIAEQLHMRPATLRTHVQNILTRLGAHSKVEAVSIAMRHGKIASTA